ncbi:hypothetical protein RF11_06835 [Thelohanellus kitauei]|uniref:Uncharacterized protein n=1 Tax=Thelohanellus kitauei TaxID=669202 RepID=A0A0C2N396_THEKT|nr:hypothetical protein RF11_06835 [Thelohanellus kitauei]
MKQIKSSLQVYALFFSIFTKAYALSEFKIFRVKDVITNYTFKNDAPDLCKKKCLPELYTQNFYDLLCISMCVNLSSAFGAMEDVWIEGEDGIKEENWVHSDAFYHLAVFVTFVLSCIVLTLGCRRKHQRSRGRVFNTFITLTDQEILKIDKNYKPCICIFTSDHELRENKIFQLPNFRADMVSTPVPSYEVAS